MTYVVKIAAGSKLSPKTLNIDDEHREDAFYRYKMRQLFVQVTGKGKMIKTNFLNVDDVAKDLRVPAAYIVSYFGYEIGAKASYDKSKPEREKGSVAGDYDQKVLSDLLLKLINEFVLCPQCKLPELTPSVVEVDGKKKVKNNCRGCGAESEPVVHPKFQKFITTNPPPKSSGFTSAATAASASSKKKAGAPQPGTSPPTTTTVPKKKKEKVEGDDDEEWTVAVDEEAVKARRKQLQDQIGEKAAEVLAVEDDEKPALENSKTKERAKEQAAGKGEPHQPGSKEELIDELTKFMAAHSILEFEEEVKKKVGSPPPVPLIHALFFQRPEDIPHACQLRAGYLGKIFTGQTDKQMQLLDYISRSYPDQQPDAQYKKQTNGHLKVLYESDILEEDAIIQWATTNKKKSTRRYRDAITPFVTWLQEADDDDEGDEEEDEEEEEK